MEIVIHRFIFRQVNFCRRSAAHMHILYHSMAHLWQLVIRAAAEILSAFPCGSCCRCSTAEASLGCKASSLWFWDSRNPREDFFAQLAVISWDHHLVLILLASGSWKNSGNCLRSLENCRKPCLCISVLNTSRTGLGLVRSATNFPKRSTATEMSNTFP